MGGKIKGNFSECRQKVDSGNTKTTIQKNQKTQLSRSRVQLVRALEGEDVHGGGGVRESREMPQTEGCKVPGSARHRAAQIVLIEP